MDWGTLGDYGGVAWCFLQVFRLVVVVVESGHSEQVQVWLSLLHIWLTHLPPPSLKV